jgi:hypothetical protein
MAQERWTQQQMTRVAAKLQEFMDKLPADEQPILGAILQQAAQGAKTEEVSGYALSPLTAEFTVYDPQPEGVEGALVRRQLPLTLAGRISKHGTRGGIRSA